MRLVGERVVFMLRNSLSVILYLLNFCHSPPRSLKHTSRRRDEGV